MPDDLVTPAPSAARVAVGIAPMLAVRGGARAVAFYQAALGAVEVYRVESPDGAVVARLAVEGAEFWVTDESPANGQSSPETLGGGSVRLILTVPDPDAAFARAVAAGANAIVPVEEAYGWRIGRLSDPFGHHWEIGRPLDSVG
jgi:PhnB protein